MGKEGREDVPKGPASAVPHWRQWTKRRREAAAARRLPWEQQENWDSAGPAGPGCLQPVALQKSGNTAWAPRKSCLYLRGKVAVGITSAWGPWEIVEQLLQTPLQPMSPAAEP